ncbi:hypothetical protein GCM10010377_12700 [Streptomyces viridiviolaceus]|uniref:HPF/RaiA family ribosome-associated protein n=1 Tax=Streptomyces viridiviolaceus TaxID=68282 RepID=A0ABW2E364_9ACTN|nr:hypothetical protein [Streptomyces viridiviolaceus]GHB24189.1 hypothetical protein GCM10010377_12700 [Streptomyces viridiviolaceus]
MAEGDSVANRGIRVRLDDTATESDIGALRKWLEREKPLDELVRAGELRIHEQRRTDETGSPMGAGMDIVMVLTGAAASTVFQEVLDRVKRAVTAWRDNRREVENGESPGARVEPVNTDDR